MSQIKNSMYRFAVILMSALVACNEPAVKNEETAAVKDSTTTQEMAPAKETAAPITIDPATDPLIVGAAFVKKIGDTLGIRMYEFTVKPGDSATLHTHPDHAFYVLQGGKLSLSIQGAERQVLDLKPGMGAVHGPLSDAGKNIGKTTIKLLVIDIYRPRGN